MNISDDTPRRLMACLSDASRYRIVVALEGGDMCVTELAAAVGLSQSCTTRHLQALGRDGIVDRRRAGKRVLFRIADQGELQALLGWMRGGRAPQAPDASGAAHEDAAGSGRKTRPAGAGRRARRAGRSKTSVPDPPPSGKTSDAAPLETPVPRDDEAEAPEARRPALRPGDLEDYLL